MGYSVKAQCTGNQAAYLDANRNTMQKPKRGRSVLAVFAVNGGFSLRRWVLFGVFFGH